MRLCDRDRRGVVKLVGELSCEADGHPCAEPSLELLTRLVPQTHVGYYEWDLTWPFTRELAVELPAVPREPDVAAAAMHYCTTYPLSNALLRSEQRPRKISDFITLRALHRLEYYDLVLRPFGVEHQMRVWLPAPRHTSYVFYLNRTLREGDFDERDRSLLELLRPFLVAFHERFELARTTTAREEYDLTCREVEVLRWVACGKTNKQIAALLVVSPNTVRTHLEHAYRKLGVHTRTAAIARAFSPLNEGTEVVTRLEEPALNS